MKENSTYPRLIVLTSFAQEQGGGGGVIVRSILEDYPSDRLLWYTLINSRQGEKWWRQDISRRTSPFFLRGRSYAPVRGFLRVVGHGIESRIAAMDALKAAVDFHADVCWAILDFNAVFAIDCFMRRCSIPVHVSVHDDPVIAAEMLNYPASTGAVHASFSRCYRSAQSRDCISQRLINKYKRELHVDAFVLTRGLKSPDVTCHEENNRLDLGSRINIIMGGASGCPDPWARIMTQTIEVLRTRKLLDVEFHTFHHDPAFRARFIHSYDPIPEPRFDVLMRKMHVGYAPDPFTELGRRFAATSMPSKIVTYIGAGVPFLYHGPLDSTVGDLLQDYDAGIIVESQEPEKLAEGFRRIFNNYNSMRMECFRAARECFDIGMLRRRLLSQLARNATLRDESSNVP